LRSLAVQLGVELVELLGAELGSEPVVSVCHF
jgi:hypothetical protein